MGTALSSRDEDASALYRRHISVHNADEWNP